MGGPRRRRGQGGQGGCRGREDGVGETRRMERGPGGGQNLGQPKTPAGFRAALDHNSITAPQGSLCHFLEPAPDPGKGRVQRNHAAYNPGEPLMP